MGGREKNQGEGKSDKKSLSGGGGEAWGGGG